MPQEYYSGMVTGLLIGFGLGGMLVGFIAIMAYG